MHIAGETLDEDYETQHSNRGKGGDVAMLGSAFTLMYRRKRGCWLPEPRSSKADRTREPEFRYNRQQI